MAELITKNGRKAIKKMAQISQCARVLGLMPTAEDFAMRLVGDLRHIAITINNISTRINEILDKYSSIPAEFLLKGFDEVLKMIDDIGDYSKFTINETLGIVSDTVKSTREITRVAGDTASLITSTVIQVGGGLYYGAMQMSADAFGYNRVDVTENVVQDVIDGKIPISEMEANLKKNSMDEYANLRKDISDVANDSVQDIDEAMGNAVEWFDEHPINAIDNAKNTATEWVDGENGIGYLKEKVETAKAEVEKKIEQVRKIFENLTKNFDEGFGWLVPKNMIEEGFRTMSNTAYEMDTPVFDDAGNIVGYEKRNSPVFDALGDATGAVADFIKNFNVGKVITALGGMYISAGAATLAMDLLPIIDVDRMMREIIGGVDGYRIDKLTELYNNKYDDEGPDLLEVPDVTWRLSKEDLEKYNGDAYENYLKNHAEANDNKRSIIVQNMDSVIENHKNGIYNRKSADEKISELSEINRDLMKDNQSALKEMRKVRRGAIKAKQIEKFKGFINIELDYLKNEFRSLESNLKREWDTMMSQYKTAIQEIKDFFSKEGSGGNEVVDRCCDRINDDATQIVDLCKSIGVEITSAVAMVPTPYAIGTCVDMPVHKILAFFKDIKIIITFLMNLIQLGIDIISQLSILAKLIFNGIQSLADILNTLKEIIGVDKILNMIDYLVSLFRPKMADAKILLENSLSPVYYNETEEYEMRHDALEGLLKDGKSEGYVDKFFYSNDIYYKGSNEIFGGYNMKDDDVDDIIEALEEKGEREIVAYRSPILNAEGDDFAGWIYYHAYAYDDMNKGWSKGKKRRINRLIKKASKKNKLKHGKLVGGVARLKKSLDFGKYENGEYIDNSVSGYDAYYWYTKWTNDPTDCTPDLSNVEYEYDKEGNIISTKAINTDVVNPIQTTQNGSLVELSDGRRVFVEGQIVKSGDFVNVEGKKYRVN